MIAEIRGGLPVGVGAVAIGMALLVCCHRSVFLRPSSSEILGFHRRTFLASVGSPYHSLRSQRRFCMLPQAGSSLIEQIFFIFAARSRIVVFFPVAMFKDAPGFALTPTVAPRMEASTASSTY